MFHEPTTLELANQRNRTELHLGVEGGGGGGSGNQSRRLATPPPSPSGRLEAQPEAPQQQVCHLEGNEPDKTNGRRLHLVAPASHCTPRNKTKQSPKATNGRRLISKRSEPAIYSIKTNLLLHARAKNKASRYNRNISLMRSFLVNYLKLTLCSCYDTAALATLFVFVLFLNNFIEAHHQQHNQQQHHHHQNNQQTSRRLGGAFRAGQLYWNRTSSHHQQPPGSMVVASEAEATSRATRARRGVVESFPLLGAPYDGGLLVGAEEDQQQRPLFDVEEVGEILMAATGSELMPLVAIVEPSDSFGQLNNHYEISRVASSSTRNSSRQQTSPHSPKVLVNRNSRGKQVQNGSTPNRSDRTNERQQSNQITRHSQGSHHRLQRQQQQQQVSSAAATALNYKLDPSDLTAAMDRTPDWSFRQAAPDPTRQATAAVTTTTKGTSTTTTSTTTTKRPYLNYLDHGTMSARPRLAMDETHWIPIGRTLVASSTETGRGPVHRPQADPRQQDIVSVSSQATSALLDYPPAQMVAPPHRHQPQAQSMASRYMRRPNRPKLQQLGSHGYGAADPYPTEFRGPPQQLPAHGPGHRPAMSTSYDHFEPPGNHHYSESHSNAHRHRHNYQHSHEHHHHHRHHHWPRRRPRFQGELDNEIGSGPGPIMRPSKIYKRVLLCDKTLVSLDYIRNQDLEPRPSQSSGQLLNEHEINEINDHFLDLETSLESSMTRLSSALGADSSDQSTRRRSNSTAASPTSGPDGAGRSISTSGNSTSEALSSSLDEPKEQMAANETSNALDQLPAAAAALLERRFWRNYNNHHNNLLSDEDPLVRCDMWDLEKGLKSRKPPEAILRQAIKADFDTVRDAINRCRQLSEKTLPPDDEYRGDGLEIMSTEDLISLFSMKRGLMPGTKWCGLGDQADSYNDLGPKHRIDICCRAHDHCPIRSKPFRNDYGVLNIGLYTKSHCDCDADFYRCLRGVRSRTADMLGNLYFNVMKLQCMREERLKVCREMKPIALGFERCVRYEDSPVKTVFKFTTPPVAY